MEFRAASNRTIEGHGTNFFSRDRLRAEAWAQREAKDGFEVVVFEVREVEVSRFSPDQKKEDSK